MNLLKSIKTHLLSCLKKYKNCLIFYISVYIAFSSIWWYEILNDPNFHIQFSLWHTVIGPFIYGMIKIINLLDFSLV